MAYSPQISFIIPSIRPEKLQAVYDSILTSWHGTFEISVVSPKQYVPLKLNPRGEIQWLVDFGCPSRAMQLGWIRAKSDWLFFATDDCEFDSDAVNIAYRNLCKRNFDYKTVIVTPFTESDNWSKWMLTPCYYHAWWHANLRSFNIPFFTKLYMNGLISKQLMQETGGFDTRFESTAWSYNEWSIRSQFYGANFIIQRERSNHCQWSPGQTGDHGPVADACKDDEALFYGRFNTKNFVRKPVIPVDNWRYAPAKWPRRNPCPNV